MANPTTRRKPRFTFRDRIVKRTGIEYFYAGLLSHGITLELLPGDMIQILAPDNNVSPVLRDAIVKRKAALLPLLRERTGATK